MATSIKGGAIAKKIQDNNAPAKPVQKNLSMIFNTLIDQQGIKNRINELLKDRAPQFTATLVSIANGSPQMAQVAEHNPMTIIQAALKAASYELPADQSLGFAYVVPFNQYNKETRTSTPAAQFILGYKGMLQLAMRSGAYKRINCVDVRETELVSYDRLTEDIKIEFIQDQTERNKKKIIGYVGYYRLVNGLEKTVYMSIDEIKSHELTHRKGSYQNPIWKDTPENANNFQAMCLKTVLRRLIGKWGIMSIDYKTANPAIVEFAENAAKGTLDDEDDSVTIDIPAEFPVEEGFMQAEEPPAAE